jgi:hypothetical protein
MFFDMAGAKMAKDEVENKARSEEKSPISLFELDLKSKGKIWKSFEGNQQVRKFLQEQGTTASICP